MGTQTKEDSMETTYKAKDSLETIGNRQMEAKEEMDFRPTLQDLL